MKRLPVIAIAGVLASCATPPPEGPTPPPGWLHQRTNSQALPASWWRGFGDPELDALVQQAWQHNPDIEVALRRAEAARADRFEALASFFPQAGLTLGFRDGREQNHDSMFRPRDLKPWTANGGISWELDITGKRRAQWLAAKAGESAAYARWQAVRLLVATETCAARLEDTLLSAEIRRLHAQVIDETHATTLSTTLLERGMISSAEHTRRTASMEALQRSYEELCRKRDNARLRLSRLLGGTPPPATSGSKPKLPPVPTRIPADVWRLRPDLIAAEADVRRAFAVADHAKLNLLPSLSLTAGGSIASSSPRDGFEMWTASIGPKLDIPVWDPARIANRQRSRSHALAASAQFRATANRAVEDIEHAFNDVHRYQRQLVSLERETRAKHQLWQDTRAKFQSGLSSEIEATDSGRSWMDSSLRTTAMRLMTIEAHLKLIRALGG